MGASKKESTKATRGTPAWPNDYQRKGYQLTINNPHLYQYDHEKIKRELITGFPTIDFFCMADEIGKQGTPHIHAYVHFRSRVRFSTIKKHFPEAHIEAANGTPAANIDYVRKSGKWEDTEKSETSVEGTYEEWGKRPSQGKAGSMEQLYQYIVDGYTDQEILEEAPRFIPYVRNFGKIRQIALSEHFKAENREDLEVIYVSGPTGTGKTRGVLEENGPANTYRITDYSHPFDRYESQPVLVFDEFRSQLRLSDMLQYCDIYPLDLPARYDNKWACYRKVYLISNWPLEDQYLWEQEKDRKSWDAFLRRIQRVKIYDKDGHMTEYSSVEGYFNRDTGFTEAGSWDQTELPFHY